MDRRSGQLHESARVRRADGPKFKQPVPGVPRVGNDLRVWGTWYDFSTNTWANADNISGGLANNAPGVSMNNATNQLTVTAQGTDNQLWMTHQTLGASGWNGWARMGVFTENTPHSAACANGNMVVSIVDGKGNPEFAKFDGWGN